MPITPQNTWVGFGANIGGMIAIAGFESMVGVMMRADRSAHLDVNASFGRIGIGLGGSGGAVILAAINCPDINYFRAHPQQDGWGFSLAIPNGRLTIPPSIARAIGEADVIARHSRDAMRLQLLRGHVDSLYNLIQAIISAGQVAGATGSGTPSFHIIGFPVVGGGGIEASVFASAGRLDLGMERATVRGMVR